MLKEAILFNLFILMAYAPPVTKPVVEQEQEKDSLSQLVYQKYLQEIVNALEEDTEFRKKLENANASYIKSDEFANELDFVGHQIREKLDEAKRREVKRLNDLMRKKDLLSKEKVGSDHMDLSNVDTFEIEDLRKLIKKTTEDLEDLDSKRREEFKHYEMQKEHQRQAELKKLNDEERKKAELDHEQEVAKHKDHPKIHHPGSKAQFEEVWEKEDHLDKEDFNAKTFFAKHDINGDGYLDQQEIEALFELELQKIYESNHTEDDLKEKFEEMARMREHVMDQVDTNKDKLISKDEYDTYVNTAEFEKDEGWKGLDEERPYTDEEYAKYEKELEDLQTQTPVYHPPPDENVKEMEAQDQAPAQNVREHR